MTGSYKIFYFPAKGRAEVSRLILEAAGVSYENKYPVEWPKEKESTPFGQLPCLIFKDASGKEHMVAQSAAMERYLAHKHGLEHKDEATQFVADSLIESLREVGDAIGMIKWHTPEPDRPKKMTEFKEKVLPAMIMNHSKFLNANGTNGYYFGTQLTRLELFLFLVVNNLNEYFGANTVNSTNAPALIKVHEMVVKHEKIAQYLVSSRCHKG